MAYFFRIYSVIHFAQNISLKILFSSFKSSLILVWDSDFNNNPLFTDEKFVIYGWETLLSVFACIARDQNRFFIRALANQLSRNPDKKAIRTTWYTGKSGLNSYPPVFKGDSCLMTHVTWVMCKLHDAFSKSIPRWLILFNYKCKIRFNQRKLFQLCWPENFRLDHLDGTMWLVTSLHHSLKEKKLNKALK